MVKRTILHHHIRFREYRSNRCWDIAIFCGFQDGSRLHLGFSKIRNFNGQSAVEARFASACQISSKLVKRCVYMAILRFSKMAAVRHLGFVGSTLEPPMMSTCMVVFSVVQNLVGIDAVVMITCRFQYFAWLRLKKLIHAPKIGFFWGGGFGPLNGKWQQRNPQKAHPCAESRHKTYRSSKSFYGWRRSDPKKVKKKNGRLRNQNMKHVTYSNMI